MIVDNFPENFALQRDNGICIKSWYGDQNDKVLMTLEKVLISELIRHDPK
jgi:CTD small phosphatase-like protein 2